MEKVFDNGKLIGIHFKPTMFKSGSIPYTDSRSHEEALGVLSLKHPKGTILKKHLHLPQKRVTNRLQECFVVLKGKARIDLFTDKKKFIKSIILEKDEAFLATSGGHGFEILENCIILELKNGPFIDDKDFF